MLIENLSKEIETKAMTAVRGGSNGAGTSNWTNQITVQKENFYAVGGSAPVVQVGGDMNSSESSFNPSTYIQPDNSLLAFLSAFPLSR